MPRSPRARAATRYRWHGCWGGCNGCKYSRLACKYRGFSARRANTAVFLHTHAGRLFLRRLSCTVHALYRFPVRAHGFPVRWWSGCRALAQARLCRVGGLCPARPGPRRGTVAARPDFQCEKAVAQWYQNPPCRAVRKPWYALGLWGGSPDHLIHWMMRSPPLRGGWLGSSHMVGPLTCCLCDVLCV